MITHVFDPLKDAMVTMTVGTIQMNGIVEVNLRHKYLIAKKIILKLFSIIFQFNALQQSSHVPTVENVSDPLGYAMVMMTVGIIPMKETVQVKFQYWPGCQNPKTEILYHQKPLYAGLGI